MRSDGPARDVLRRNQGVFEGQLDINTVHIQVGAVVLFESVNLVLRHIGEISLNLLHLLAVLLAQGLEVGLHVLHEDVVVGRKELDILDVDLTLDEVRHLLELRLHLLARNGNHDL